MKFDHDILSMYHEIVGQKILKLHCPDNHEVRIICNLDLYDTKNVYKVSNLVTVPLEETEQFHRLVHEASKEVRITFITALLPCQGEGEGASSPFF
jgi:hypothetical protein